MSLIEDIQHPRIGDVQSPPARWRRRMPNPLRSRRLFYEFGPRNGGVDTESDRRNRRSNRFKRRQIRRGFAVGLPIVSHHAFEVTRRTADSDRQRSTGFFASARTVPFREEI